MKRLIRKILREEINKSDKHYRRLDIISDHVHLPYFESMVGLTIDDEDDQLYIVKKIYGYNVGIKGKYIYDEYYDVIYDDRGGEIYIEKESDGSWDKREYDDRGKMLYSEDSDGYWWKYEYDGRGNKIYQENSNDWWKWEYDDKGNPKYFEDSSGIWKKYEYNDSGKLIYQEDSSGDWEKNEYDYEGNIIYSENSNGNIWDNR
jgi:YD repeat-containing protein